MTFLLFVGKNHGVWLNMEGGVTSLINSSDVASDITYVSPAVLQFWVLAWRGEFMDSTPRCLPSEKTKILSAENRSYFSEEELAKKIFDNLDHNDLCLVALYTKEGMSINLSPKGILVGCDKALGTNSLVEVIKDWTQKKPRP